MVKYLVPIIAMAMLGCMPRHYNVYVSDGFSIGAYVPDAHRKYFRDRYRGSDLPHDKVSIVHASDGAVIVDIDGENIGYIESRLDLNYAIPPGPHIVIVELVGDVTPCSNEPTDLDGNVRHDFLQVIRSRGIGASDDKEGALIGAIAFEAEAGYSYKIAYSGIFYDVRRHDYSVVTLLGREFKVASPDDTWVFKYDWQAWVEKGLIEHRTPEYKEVLGVGGIKIQMGIE
jgi:hypothetical protein